MLLKAMGASFAPSILLLILSAIAGFIIAITAPTGPGHEMGGAFAFPFFVFFGAIASIIVYILSCIIFLIWGLSPKLFWWVTLTPNAFAVLIAGLLLLLNIRA